MWPKPQETEDLVSAREILLSSPLEDLEVFPVYNEKPGRIWMKLARNYTHKDFAVDSNKVVIVDKNRVGLYGRGKSAGTARNLNVFAYNKVWMYRSFGAARINCK